MFSFDLFSVQSLKFILFSIVSYFVYVNILRPVLHWIHMVIHYHGFPSYPKHFLFGHLKRIWPNFPFTYNLEKVQKNIYITLETIAAHNPERSLAVPWILLYPLIMAPYHELVEIVLNKKNLTRPEPVNFVALGDGLITSTPDIWKVRRKLVEPFFSTKRLKSYVKMMNEEVESFSQKLSSEVDKPIDLEQPIHISTLNIILKAMTSIPLNDSMQEKKAILEIISDMGINSVKRLLNPFYYFDWIFKFSAFGKTYFETQNRFLDVMNKIQRRRKQLLSSSPNEPENRDLVDVLEDKIDRQGVHDELITMIAAGHETTALSVRWILFHLGNHLEAQERLYQEIIEFFPGDTPLDDMDKINECTYLDQCIKESLRLSPPVHSVARMLQENMMVNDKKLLKDSIVVVPIASVHLDPKVYPEPDKYDPDRWSPENAAKIPKAAFIPFSYGPRSCVGYRYAILELKIYTIKIIREFQVKAVGKHGSIPVKYQFTAKPVLPLEIIMTQRNNN